jgi:hypothetical protein
MSAALNAIPEFKIKRSSLSPQDNGTKVPKGWFSQSQYF